MDSIPQFLIAAPTSGSGKTTVSRGLMALFVKKGLKVQPFKCGPDYIDTKYHEAVCGRPSVNLDTFMASPEHVRSLYARYSADADVAVVEGMMGMYDGYDRDRGSSAEVARLLGIPVVLWSMPSRLPIPWLLCCRGSSISVRIYVLRELSSIVSAHPTTTGCCRRSVKT